MGLCLAPQTGELTASSAQPAPTPCMGTSVEAALEDFETNYFIKKNVS